MVDELSQTLSMGQGQAEQKDSETRLSGKYSFGNCLRALTRVELKHRTLS